MLAELRAEIERPSFVDFSRSAGACLAFALGSVPVEFGSAAWRAFSGIPRHG